MSTPDNTQAASDAPQATDLVQAAFGSFIAARDALDKQLQELQEMDLRLSKRRDAVAENTLSFEDYLLLLKDDIQHCAATYAANHFLAHPSTEHPDMLNTWTDYQAGMVPKFVGILNGAMTMGALCFFFPDIVYTRMANALKANYGDAWPNSCDVPYAQREQLVKDIDKQRSELKKQRRQLNDQKEQLKKAANQR